VDLNRAMATTARGSLARAGVAAALVQGNVEALPYRDAAFDTVVNTMAFSGYPDGARALGELVRVVRPGGRIVLIDVAYPADGRRLGTWLAGAWKLAGDLIRDLGPLLDAQGLEWREETIGGAGSIHLWLATRPDPAGGPSRPADASV
jgi:ubiquinone/menaquinone biosynthesis C-methylase UbiE